MPHTPGPWFYEDDIMMVGNRLDRIICDLEMQDSVRSQNLDADGNLIAAAPALLAACEYALQVWDSSDPNERIMARDLIASTVKRAKGGQ